jgi:tetratricopeptide (TPR) repeat protein
MSTREVPGPGSRLDRWLEENFDQLLPWKRRAEAFYYEKRAESAKESGDYESAKKYYDEAVSVRGRLGDRETAVDLGLRLAAVAREHGDLATAKQHYKRVVELHARRKNAKEALDALEPMLEVIEEMGDDEELGTWWGHALMILGKADPDEVPMARRDRLVTQYADQIYNEESAGRLYGIGLQRVLAGEEETGADLLDATWERREVVREQVGQFLVVLAAGVGRVAYAELSDREVDREETLEFVADHRDRLSEAATVLFDYLYEGETDADPEDLQTGVEADDEAELRDVEAEVFGQFLERLD